MRLAAAVGRPAAALAMAWRPGPLRLLPGLPRGLLPGGAAGTDCFQPGLGTGDAGHKTWLSVRKL